MPFPWISPATIEHLGWTLIHFVWQGALVALLLKVVLLALRNHSASVRYIVAYGALVLMAASTVGTFSWYALEATDGQPAPHADATLFNRLAGIASLSEPPSASPGLHHDPAWRDASLAPGEASAGQEHRALLGVVEAALERHLAWIVAVWLLGVVVMALWLVAGWLRIQTLRRRYVEPALEHVTRTVKALARELGIRRSVRVLESCVLETPVTFGWLRPVILLPVSALAGLSPQQLEAILTHELSHIRRHDYLLNLIQSVLEAILFYHPALWWVSRRVRVERENCCDDCAVALCGDRLAYVRALASLEELRRAPRLAAAATGDSLLGRIRRLLGRPSEVHEGSRWHAGVAVFLSLATTLAGLSLSGATGEQSNTSAQDESPGVRVLVFPTDRSYGEVRVNDHGSWTPLSKWIRFERLADARGRVIVPAGKETWLYSTTATDLSGLTSGDLRALDGLYLRGSPLGDAGLRGLPDLESLKYVSLERTGISDATLKRMARWTNLEKLNVSGNDVTDAGLAHLRNLTKLKRLGVVGSSVTDEGLAHLAGLQELLALRLPQGITDAGLRHLAPLGRLERVDLGATQVTDAGIEHLRGMTHLSEVLLPLHITQKGHDKLWEVLPHLEDTPEQVHVLTVLVVDRDTEEPILDLPVRVDVGVEAYRPRTDRHGKLQLNVPTNATGLGIHFSQSGPPYVPVRAFWRADEMSRLPAEYTLRLEKGTRIGGIVQDEAGDPIAGATVHIDPRRQSDNPRERLRFAGYRRTTNSEGRWQAEHIPAEVESISFRLSHPDHTGSSSTTPAQSMGDLRAMNAVMVMRSAGRPLSGLVTDEAGNPILGALVKLDPTALYYPSRSTDASGLYRFPHRPEGFLDIMVQAKGFAPGLVRGVDAQRVDIVLGNGHTLRGRVVDENGDALAGVRVRVKSWRDHDSRLWEQVSDVQGRFEWDSAPNEAIRFNFYKSGYARGVSVELEPGEPERVITLPGHVVVSGKVADTETG